jgi:hypothetical protein
MYIAGGVGYPVNEAMDDERSYEFQSAIRDLYVETVLVQTSGTTWYITQRVSLTV